ncbi:hypothetical protein V1478_006155 [Vespula squamosa]|uniref:Uncharacterized protein n=1 Tax=Vespula squamosa TaxID=30214 RepID=A0ABD2B7F6_VESSQ
MQTFLRQSDEVEVPFNLINETSRKRSWRRGTGRERYNLSRFLSSSPPPPSPPPSPPPFTLLLLLVELRSQASTAMKEERRPRESKESGPHEVVFKLQQAHGRHTPSLFFSYQRDSSTSTPTSTPISTSTSTSTSTCASTTSYFLAAAAPAAADIRELIFELVWRDAKTDLKVILSVRSSRKSCRQGDCYEFGAGPISTSLNGIVAEDQAFPSLQRFENFQVEFRIQIRTTPTLLKLKASGRSINDQILGCITYVNYSIHIVFVHVCKTRSTYTQIRTHVIQKSSKKKKEREREREKDEKERKADKNVLIKLVFRSKSDIFVELNQLVVYYTTQPPPPSHILSDSPCHREESKRYNSYNTLGRRVLAKIHDPSSLTSKSKGHGIPIINY